MVMECKVSHKNRDKRAAALNEIAKTISRSRSTSPSDVKKKLDILRNQHRREVRPMCTSKKSGVGADETYRPEFWYFDLLSFQNDGDCTAMCVKL